MKSKRREFLKLTGMAGIGLAGKRFIPEYPSIYQEHDKIISAPEWVQKADMFTAERWYSTSDSTDTKNPVWQGYDIELEDVRVDRIVRLASANGYKKKTEQRLAVIDGTFDGTELKGVPLITHCPISKTAFSQAHEQGFRLIPYVHFTDIHLFYSDQDIFLFQHPEVLMKDSNGKWVHIPMDGTDRVFRLLTCTNNPGYVRLSLDYVKKIMDWGSDGIFIDNTNKRLECYAHKSRKTLNPEFGQYEHVHIYPDQTHNFAFTRFLEQVRLLVKSYGDDKIVMLNSGIGEDFQIHGDLCEWESFIYSWSWEGRRKEHSWNYIKERAKTNEWYFNAGCRVMAKSTLNPSRKEVKDDAYWAFSAARLAGFIWKGNLRNTGASWLYKAHLGAPLEPLKETDQVAYKSFEDGVVVLNDSSEDITKTLILSKEFRHNLLMDMYDGKQSLNVRRGQVKITIPKQSARVYISSDSFQNILQNKG